MDKLISFSLPLMLSGILQLMFNAVDIIMVGRFSGSQALAAVGSTTALINVFTNLFYWYLTWCECTCCPVLCGRKRPGNVRYRSYGCNSCTGKRYRHGICGTDFSRWALELMGTPDDVIGQSALYMKIYFLGMPFFMLYNYGAAILRAVGDTKTSTDLSGYFRCCKCSTESDPRDHVSYGCGGRSIATVISQLISCILVLRCLRTSKPATSFILEIKDQYCLFKTDFPGWDSRPGSRAQSLICQMLCFSPRLTPLDRPPWQGIRRPIIFSVFCMWR